MPQLMERYFSRDDLNRLEQVVTEAESRTDGEIALAITPRSTGWLRDGWPAAALLGLLTSLACMMYTHHPGWGAAYDYGFATAAGALCFVLAYLTLRLPWIRTGTSKAVWRKALRHFHRLRPTRARTGVLLYISLAEQQVAVVADTAIAAKVPGDYWDTPRDLILAGFRSGRQVEGIASAVAEVGAQLAQHFPRSADDTDELPNRPQVV